MPSKPNLQELSAKLGWSQRVVTRLTELPQKHPNWTEVEIQTVQRLYPTTTAREIARQMRTRSEDAVRDKAKELGIKKGAQKGINARLMNLSWRRRRQVQNGFDQDEAS